MNFDDKSMKQLRRLILFTIVILIALWNYAIIFGWIRFAFGIIFPFLLGGAIAFVLNVPMNFLEEKIFHNKYLKEKKAVKKLARPVSLILTIAIVIGVVVLVMFIVIPELTETVLSLGRTIRTFIPDAQRFLEDLFKDNSEISRWLAGMNLNVDQIVNRAMSFFQNGAGDVLNSTISAAKSMVSVLTSSFIAFVFACYILLQKEKLGLQCRKALFALLPKRVAERVISVCSLSHRVFSSFITGQCVEAVILGTMFFVAMSILKMPYALLVGCLIAVTALIPIVGAFIGCGVGAFLILMVSPMQALIFVIMFLILQQVEGNLIYPHVVGSSVGLPSIWVLFAVTVGGSLMGVLGMLLFIPLTSVLYTLFREFVYKRLREKNIRVK